MTDLSDATAELTLSEYFKGAPGRTEYPEDLHGIRLIIDGNTPADTAFDYSNTQRTSLGVSFVAAEVPQVNTRVELRAEGSAHSGAVTIGHLFSPYFTLILTHKLQGNGTVNSCLNLTRINS